MMNPESGSVRGSNICVLGRERKIAEALKSAVGCTFDVHGRAGRCYRLRADYTSNGLLIDRARPSIIALLALAA